MTDVRRFGTVLLTILGLFLVAGAFWVSTGFYIIDEVVYVFAAETFLKTQGFFLENGYNEFGSRDLRWIDLLVHRTEGLTAQYPAGSAVVGAGLISVLDLRGILLFHALCVAGSAFVTRALALKLFKDEKIALAAGLITLLIADLRLTRLGGAPAWWPRLRWPAMCGIRRRSPWVRAAA